MRTADKERVLVEVTSRVLNRKSQDARDGGIPLENLLNDTLFHERKRLEREPRSSARTQDIQMWNEVGRALGRGSEEELRDLLRRIIERYIVEIMGNFHDTFYRITTGVVPVGLNMLLKGISPARLMEPENLMGGLDRSVIISGQVEELQNLYKLGTVMMVPTHNSHMDSIVVAWTLHRLGLPPSLYGAGLNLFSNPIMGFFMGNLGAYRVDRNKKNGLYKDVLKHYSAYSMEIGYHNLFFPGGTRSRSGAVEQRLKLGLMGTGLSAYIQNLRAGRVNPRIFFVPVTIGYPLVLEAETLIEDHLKEAGKARYIITDDEFSRPRRVWNFLRDVIQLEARIHVRFGEPLDPFGNFVNGEGQSLDIRGRHVDTTRYVSADEIFDSDEQRDNQYTRELGNAIARSFKQNNTVLSTNILAFTMFRLLRSLNPELDLYRLLRTGGKEDSLPMAQVYTAVEVLISFLCEMEEAGKIVVEPHLKEMSLEDIIHEALRYFGSYHTHHVLERRGDRIFAEDMNLLYFYHNRLTEYGIEKSLDEKMTGRAA